MHHPRRNEVFRDVGSAPRLRDDTEFVDTRSFLFRDDAALLLCSDGLTDCVNAAAIAAILERFDGDADRSAQQLVEAANAAGGKDNVSVVFVVGSSFTGVDSKHHMSRARAMPLPDLEATPFLGGFPRWLKYLLLTLTGIALGWGLWQSSFVLRLYRRL